MADRVCEWTSGNPPYCMPDRVAFPGRSKFFGIVESMDAHVPVPDFFDYNCDRCGAPVCERVQIMNLALDNVDELFCLVCLAEEQEMGPVELAEFAKAYVYSRECFKTPWDAFKAKSCPRLSTGECYCQDTEK